MRRVGDRRSHVRLDVVGHLWGTLETSKRAQVVNVSEGGALLLGPISLPVNTEHEVELTSGGRDTPVRIRVRHVRPVGENEFQLGVEVVGSTTLAP